MQVEKPPDPLRNQQCRVCEEPAAGFHFGAFTCEGCKSFFGRTCNNQSVIQECKNNYTCVIDKKNRTACKACRLRKCLMVGMSKSGSRYGRRSNWFKIHCLMQQNMSPTLSSPSVTASPHLPRQAVVEPEAVQTHHVAEVLQGDDSQQRQAISTILSHRLNLSQAPASPEHSFVPSLFPLALLGSPLALNGPESLVTMLSQHHQSLLQLAGFQSLLATLQPEAQVKNAASEAHNDSLPIDLSAQSRKRKNNDEKTGEKRKFFADNNRNIVALMPGEDKKQQKDEEEALDLSRVQ